MSDGERERIERLRRILARDVPGVVLGIGDDAAILAPAAGPLVWTIDEQVDGVHFALDLLSLEDVGYRATMASASDLAAMGAAAVGALASVVAPKFFSVESFEEIAAGQRAAADALGSAVVGGNVSAGPCLSIATTWLGRAARPVTRGGARVGDGVYLAGPVGLAAAGFAALKRGVAVPEAAVRAWRRPVARLEDGLRLAERATASIDVSDGLAGDAGHIAAASGVALRLDAAALRASLPEALSLSARALDLDPLDLALYGGEDYALVATSPAPIEGFAWIGDAHEGEGVWLSERGSVRALRGGFDHFA